MPAPRFALPLRRRDFLRTLATAAFAGPSVRAWAEAAALQITVERGNWGSASSQDVNAVVNSAAREVWKHCAGCELDPIHVYRRTDFPQTDFLRDREGRIRIGLAAENARWAQFTFQFGHEFCHVLAQHSATGKRGWRQQRHANMWLEESLCETSALFTLRGMATTWRDEPPFPQWRGYAPALTGYASARLALPEHQLPKGQSFAAWFRENESALRASAVLRAKNTLIASQLLPIFEANPSGWEAVCHLNLGTHDTKKPLVRHLAEWRQNCPPTARPVVGKIAAVFGLAV